MFYPGAAGVQFLNQYAQAGIKAQIPLYTAFTIDELSLPLQKENALGVPGAQQWVNDLPNPENKKFVDDYRKKYPNLRRPSTGRSPMMPRADQQRGGGGQGRRHQEGRDEGRDGKGQLQSVRGPFKYGNNHIPIQNFYLQDVVKDADGQLALKTVATIVKDSQDGFAGKCPMK